jgi:acetyltransferase-like isoleucine patch superfamily enzyme
MQRFRNKIRVDKNATIEIDKSAKIVRSSITIKGVNNKLIILENAKVLGTTLEIIGDNCTITIGKESMIGDNCYLSSKENGIRLTIGDKCGLSRNVKVMTSDGHPIYHNGRRINFAKDIKIEDNVWIGDSVTILKGVTIGSGSVVGINSTVSKDVESNSIAVGNPAKVVKKDITWKAEL